MSNISNYEHEHELGSKHEHEHAENSHTPRTCDGEGHEHHHHADGSCCCHHHEKEFHGIDRVMAVRLIISGAMYICGLAMPISENAEALLMVGAALIAGYDIFIQAVKNLFSKKLFDEYFLMVFAAVAACIVGEYEEGAAVMVLYRVGEICQDYAIRHSRKTLYTFTGESDTNDVQLRGETDRFITKFSKIYTPVILALAALAVVGLPILDGDMTYSQSLYRALSFLVLACPCAIVISVPLAYFAGMGTTSKNGIFFHDTTAIDALAKDEHAAEAFSESELHGGKCVVYGDSRKIPDIVLKPGADKHLAISIAKRTRRIAYENIIFVIMVKSAVLVLSALGVSALWFAVFADSGVAIVAVLNSLRAFRARKTN